MWILLKTWYSLQPVILKKIITSVFGLIIISFLYFSGTMLLKDINEGLFTEIIGILITIFLIDRLRNIDDQERYKQDLIRQAGSRANPNAIDAIEIMRDKEWLEKDSIKLLAKANLTGANLTGANLSNIHLQESRFDKATLDNADLQDAILTNASFSEAELKRTNFGGAYLAGADFSDAKLENCRFKKDNDDLADATFVDKNDIAKFDRATLKSITFLDLTLNNTSFKDAYIENVVFDEAHLQNAIFVKAHFIKTSFYNTKLQGAQFSDEGKFANTGDVISFESAQLISAHLENCTFINTNFSSAKLNSSYCNNVTFHGCDMRGVNLSGAIIIGVKFIKVIFNEENTLPDGRILKHLWDNCDNNSTDIVGQFKNRVFEYLKNIGIQELTECFFIYKEKLLEEGLELDFAKFFSPKSQLPESQADKLALEDDEFGY